MKKNLQSFLAISLVMLAFLAFSSCEKKYYTEDSSANWDVLNFTVDQHGGNNKGKWLWNNTMKRYECEFDISSENNFNLDDFIYNEGVAIGYLFLGANNAGETQFQLPFYSDVERASFWYDTSISRDNYKRLTVRFYLQWDDKSSALPPLYNFRLALVWGK